MQYRCAILGCGARANGHAAAYSLVERGALVASCDMDPSRLTPFADQYNIPGRYASLDDMLSREKPDLVHVVTKPNVRVDVMCRLADAGVPAVVVEKPICVGGADYAAQRRLQERTSTKFAVNHQLRHHPRVLEFLDRIQAGEIGQVRIVDASAGLPIAGQGIHILDLMFAFSGYPRAEKVFAAASGYDDIDGTHASPRSTSAVITFEGGIRGILQSGEGYPVFEPNPYPWMHKRVAVYGTHGHLHWRMAGWERSARGRRVLRGPQDYGAQDIQGQAALTNAMFDWLEDAGRPAPTNLTTSLDEWLVLLGCYESALKRRSVDLPFEPAGDLVEQYRAQAA